MKQGGRKYPGTAHRQGRSTLGWRRRCHRRRVLYQMVRWGQNGAILYETVTIWGKTPVADSVIWSRAGRHAEQEKGQTGRNDET